MYCLPKSEGSTFVAVFDPSTKKKCMQYTDLDSRISIILPVNNTVSASINVCGVSLNTILGGCM